MDAAEVEFLAEKELVTIIPNFSLDKIYLIGVRAGPGICLRPQLLRKALVSELLRTPGLQFAEWWGGVRGWGVEYGCGPRVAGRVRDRGRRVAGAGGVRGGGRRVVAGRGEYRVGGRRVVAGEP